MLATFRVKHTKRNATYVNGVLMRTRSAGQGAASTDWAARVIMKDILLETGTLSDSTVPYDVTITVSDTELNDSFKLIRDGEVHPPYRHSHFSNYFIGLNNMYLPCPFWFKKLTGIEPPKVLYLVIDRIATA